jgi:hypothetical protein
MRRAVGNLIHGGRAEAVASRIAVHNAHQGIASSLLSLPHAPGTPLGQHTRALGDIPIYLAEVVIQYEPVATVPATATCLYWRPGTRTAATRTASLCPGTRRNYRGHRTRSLCAIRGGRARLHGNTG